MPKSTALQRCYDRTQFDDESTFYTGLHCSKLSREVLIDNTQYWLDIHYPRIIVSSQYHPRAPCHDASEPWLNFIWEMICSPPQGSLLTLPAWHSARPWYTVCRSRSRSILENTLLCQSPCLAHRHYAWAPQLFYFCLFAGGHFLTPVLGSDASSHPRSVHRDVGVIVTQSKHP